MVTMLRAGSGLLALVLLFGAAQPEPQMVRVGRFDFESGGRAQADRAPEGLSGITYIGSDQYLAVSDRQALLHPLVVKLDTETGAIQSAAFGEPLELHDTECEPLAGPGDGPDRDGITYDPVGDAVWIANERTGDDGGQPSLMRHSLETGCATAELRVPHWPGLGAYSSIRPNLGFEGVAHDPASGALWTANEDALEIDGPRPTHERGAVVRFVRLDLARRFAEQFAYLVDPLPAPRPRARFSTWASGVSDLMALPDGRLIALERAVVGLIPPLGRTRIRLYLVNVSGAAPIDPELANEGLDGRTYIPLSKILLSELIFGIDSNSNFEGMTFGPRLANGDRSVLLVADNGTGTHQSLYALRFTGAP